MGARAAALCFVIGCADMLDIERVPEATEVCVGDNGPAATGLFALCVNITPPITFVSRDTLLRMTRLAGRPIDLADIDKLEGGDGP